MTGTPDRNKPQQPEGGLSGPLADYADRLLLGTDLDAADAVLIASGQLVPPDELRALGSALQAGWLAEDSA
jgi:hypothetical protein